ncbi:class I SAM-dependent methyltransferase [Longispora albida]|uniref:class I SAM-dependent methyltransferase n=1 Tax=Longispora albida TaxID=203523 RepID=UPI0003616B84|nr:class I SAM-dependent methyltransferase [Longispora albida]
MTTTVFDEAERRKWAGKAGAYAAGFAKLCAFPVPALVDAAVAGPGTRLLDVGTGTGTVAAEASARGCTVTAVDADPGMLEAAARAVPDAELLTALLPVLPFPDGEFDAVVANFVLNHVGRPSAAAAELRRVTRPGGRVAATIWAASAGPGQGLLGRAVAAAGVTPPAGLPGLEPGDEFPRTPDGFAALLRDSGLSEVSCELLTWQHRTTAREWWEAAVTGVATIGQTIVSQPPAVIATIKNHFEVLSAEFTAPDGALLLPHTALLAFGTA